MRILAQASETLAKKPGTTAGALTGSTGSGALRDYSREVPFTEVDTTA
jgi:hypothetical protein